MDEDIFALRAVDRLRHMLRDNPGNGASSCQRVAAVFSQSKYLEQITWAALRYHHQNRNAEAERFDEKMRELGIPLDPSKLLDELPPLKGEELVLHESSSAFRTEGYGEHSLVPSLLKSGQPAVAEFRRGHSRYIVKVVPYRTHLPSFVSADISELGSGSEAEIRNPLFRLTRSRRSESPFSPQFRDICRKFQFNPDWNRPRYCDDQLANTLICAAQHAIWPTNISLRYCWVFEMLITTLDTLCVDGRRPEGQKVKEGRKYARYLFHGGSQPYAWRDQPPVDDVREDLRRNKLLDAIQLCADHLLAMDTSQPLAGGFCTFEFLPSRYGTGCIPSLYGWAGDPSWVANYGDLEGIALRPNLDPDDLIRRAAFEQLERQGVVFLNDEETQAYLDDEGSDWANYFGYGRVPDGFTLREEPEVVSWFRRLMWPIFRRAA